MTGRTSDLSLTAHLQSIKPPWTVLLVLKAGQRAESVVKIPEGFLFKVIRGKKCRTATGLFAEVAEVLEFPDYLGHNWDALEECLADLEWLPAKGYVLVFTDSELILPDDELHGFRSFVRQQAHAANRGRQSIPLVVHVLVVVLGDDGGVLARQVEVGELRVVVDDRFRAAAHEVAFLRMHRDDVHHFIG